MVKVSVRIIIIPNNGTLADAVNEKYEDVLQRELDWNEVKRNKEIYIDGAEPATSKVGDPSTRGKFTSVKFDILSTTEPTEGTISDYTIYVKRK